MRQAACLFIYSRIFIPYAWPAKLKKPVAGLTGDRLFLGTWTPFKQSDLENAPQAPAAVGVRMFSSEFQRRIAGDHLLGLLISWPMTPPTAAPPTVPTALPPVKAEPPTAPTPAPIAVFLSCADIPAHPPKPSSITAATALNINLCIVFMGLPPSSTLCFRCFVPGRVRLAICRRVFPPDPNKDH